jgi:hypothetical protein
LAALNPGGRFVILDYSFETEAADRMDLMSWGFFASLKNLDFKYETADELAGMLDDSGFDTISESRPLMKGLVIEAFKKG